jgi:isopentenyl-diphosphate delta-isomerase
MAFLNKEQPTEILILVDNEDNEIGLLDKTTVHHTGVLHRAFSVFVLNSRGELLLQQRALAKYHSPGLWSNTCCSHPRKGEDTVRACERRLQEEMGMSCDLQFAFSFIYRAEFDNGLIEHEFDHVYLGYSDELPQHDSGEVMGSRYISFQDLQNEISTNPENYTEWLKICLPRVAQHLESL